MARPFGAHDTRPPREWPPKELGPNPINVGDLDGDGIDDFCSRENRKNGFVVTACSKSGDLYVKKGPFFVSHCGYPAGMNYPASDGGMCVVDNLSRDWIGNPTSDKTQYAYAPWTHTVFMTVFDDGEMTARVEMDPPTHPDQFPSPYEDEPDGRPPNPQRPTNGGTGGPVDLTPDPPPL